MMCFLLMILRGGSVPKLTKQNTATSEITMSNLNSANPSAFTSHASINLDDNASVKSSRSNKSQEGKDQASASGAPGWVAPSAGGDIERLTNLLYHYEVMNFNQQRDIDHYKGTYEALAKTIGDQEREKLKTNKKMKTLESTMKYDKIASDGIKKKYNLLEIEVKDLRAARDVLTTDLNHYKAENLELLDMLNEDRSNRLKLMHENDKLKKHNAFLVQMQSEAEQCNVKANNILLERLHQLESLVAINKVQSATISGQSQEMLVLTAEVETLKSEALDISSQVIEHSETNASLKNVIRLLQDEVSRLRRELTVAAMDSSHRMISTNNSRSSARRTNKYIATVKEIPSGGHPLLYEPLDIERRASTAMAGLNRGTGNLHDRRSDRVEAARRSLSPEGSMRSSSRSRGAIGGEGGGERRSSGSPQPSRSRTAGGSSSGFLGGEESEGGPLRAGESQFSETTTAAKEKEPASYFCNNNKAVFDDQKPAAVLDRENYLRAIQSRGGGAAGGAVRAASSRGGPRSNVVTPLATLKRPPNLDRDTLGLGLGGTSGSSTLVDEFSGLMTSSLSVPRASSRGGGSRGGAGVAAPSEGLEEYSQSAERMDMLGKIAQSGIKPKKKRIGLGGGEPRPKTVSSNSSSAEAASLKESITSNIKKAYSMSPKAASLYKNKSISQSAVSMLTTSVFTSGGESGAESHNQSRSSGSKSPVAGGGGGGGVVPVLPAISSPVGESTDGRGLSQSVSFSLGHNTVSASDSRADSVDSRQHSKKSGTGGSKVTSASVGPKTIYVSRGLNFKHNEELDSQLNGFGAGSTKEILKKILGDREFV